MAAESSPPGGVARGRSRSRTTPIRAAQQLEEEARQLESQSDARAAKAAKAQSNTER